jgi:hypothetical protein
MVHQDLAHEAGGDAEELGAVFDPQRRLIDEPEIRLMHQGSALQSVIASLRGEVVAGQPAEFVVH